MCVLWQLDKVRMRHLKTRAVSLDATADNPPRADREGAGKVIRMRMEVDELDDRRVVRAAHAVGLARVARWNVVENVDRDGRDPSFLRFCQRWLV